jgi:hypothetical protein
VATVQLAVANEGSAAAEAVTAGLRVVDPATSAVLASVDLPAGTVAPGASFTATHPLPMAGLPLGVYAATLVAVRGSAAEVLATARFRVADAQPPRLVLADLAPGACVGPTVLARLRADDDASGVAGVRAAVDGAPGGALALESGNPAAGTWSALLALGAEGAHLVTFTARDVEGNDGAASPAAANPLTIPLVVDSVAPRLAIRGVGDGALLAAPPAPSIDASDAHLASATARLDGAPWTPGAAVTAEGDHVLEALAVDCAGNTASAAVRFALDLTPPSIVVAGVEDGAFYASGVTPAFAAADAHLDAASATLDGAPFTPGETVAAEGAHALAVTATDLAGHRADRAVAFTIDLTPPAVAIGGVAEGGSYAAPVHPTFTATDAHLASVTATLDGVPFASGDAVTAPGRHVLAVEARDRAGLAASASASFTIATASCTLAKGLAERFPRVAALVAAPGRGASPEDVARVRSWLAAALGDDAALVAVTRDEADLLRALRSGEANVVLLVGAAARPLALAPELVEAVFGGRVGLVAARPTPSAAPELREALGADTLGAARRQLVSFDPGAPLGAVGWLRAEGGSVELALHGAEPAARWADPGRPGVAAAAAQLGLGRSVTLGFDPSRALPTSAGADLARAAVAWVVPASAALAPLGVAAVELRLEGGSGEAVVREALAPELTALLAVPPATTFDPHELSWVLGAPGDGAAVLRYLARLPDAAGAYEVVTTAGAACEARLALTVARGGAELAAAVRAELAPCHAPQDRARAAAIRRRLDDAAAATGGRAGVEDALRVLLAAADDARALRCDARDDVRLALGELIRYWEARWPAP